MTQWISVKDRLPKLCADGCSKMVLAWDGFDCCIVFYAKKNGWISWYDRFETEAITHWLSLPQLPEGGGLV